MKTINVEHVQHFCNAPGGKGGAGGAKKPVGSINDVDDGVYSAGDGRDVSAPRAARNADLPGKPNDGSSPANEAEGTRGGGLLTREMIELKEHGSIPPLCFVAAVPKVSIHCPVKISGYW
jgi:hypothetical protein